MQGRGRGGEARRPDGSGAPQDCTSLDEHGIAAALLPLVTAFCRVSAGGPARPVPTRLPAAPLTPAWPRRS